MHRDPLCVEAVVVLAGVLAAQRQLDVAILELRRFKELVSVPDPNYARWLIAEAEEAESLLLLQPVRKTLKRA